MTWVIEERQGLTGSVRFRQGVIVSLPFSFLSLIDAHDQVRRNLPKAAVIIDNRGRAGATGGLPLWQNGFQCDQFQANLLSWDVLRQPYERFFDP